MKHEATKRLRIEMLEARTMLALPSPVKINELMPHPRVDTDPDWIELYNTLDTSLNIGGWYLSDTSDRKLWRIPTNTTIPGKGYVVFDDRQYGAVMGLEEERNTVRLTKYLPDGITIEYEDERTYPNEAPPTGVLFGAAQEVSFGRYKRSDGEVEFVPLSEQTRGGANAYPLVGDIAINEIMYNPGATGVTDEFIELYNHGTSRIYFYTLADLPSPAPWMFTRGVTFTFPSTTTYLDPGKYGLVVGISPATFRAKYGISTAVQIWGPWTGSLDGAGERVSLFMPEFGSHDSPDGQTPYYFVDSVEYKDSAPWPTAADGGGSSLARRAPNLWGDDSTSWVAATPTPGARNSSVMGRYTFYNGSAFDNGTSAGDSASISTDKEALLPGQLADFHNITSYDRGINGIIVDLADATTTINKNDFVFQIGNNNSPAGWGGVASPTVTATAGAGVAGSTRVFITWPDNLIKNMWLRVTVKGGSGGVPHGRTGLLNPDVFYFGNLAGESGDTPPDAIPPAVASAKVEAIDELDARTHRSGLQKVAITDDQDFNRDRLVNATDDIIARKNLNASLVLLTSTPAAAAAAAAAAVTTEEPAAVSLAVAAPVTTSSTAVVIPSAAGLKVGPALPDASRSSTGATRAWEWLPWMTWQTPQQARARQPAIARAADQFFAGIGTLLPRPRDF